jgi:WSC domain
MASLQMKAIFLILTTLNLSAPAIAGSHAWLHPHLHARSVLHKRALVTPSNPYGNWTFQGCYTDSVGSRTLNAATYNGNTVTDEACVAFCDGKSYSYAGTEYSGQCYCDNEILSPGALAAAGDCNMACTGNSSEACGGSNRLTLFYSGVNRTVTGPVVNPGPPGWKSLGCYNDTVGMRTLPVNPQTAGGQSVMTIALCTSACQQGGYNISGAEYAGECYCGTQFLNGGAPAVDGSVGCDMVCNGNSSEYCGGPNRLNVYAQPYVPPPPAGWNALGCYTDAQASRTLNTTEYLNTAMTIEVCTSACKTAGFMYAGVEYADECYCGNALQNGGGPAPDGSAGCNMPCNGNSLETCGGSNRLNLFLATNTTSSSSNSTTSSAPAATGTANNSTLPAGWGYKGCYIDGANGRDMNYQQPDNSTLTIESCVQTCIGLGYSVAGAEYSTQCFCDDFIRNGANLTADTDCSMTCSGNSSEFCGAGNRLSIYSNATLQVYQPPAVQQTGLPGNWTYQGCLYDDAVTRTFPYQIEFLDNNTATNCLSLCAQYGYGAGGMEYGQQCFCGDQADIAAAGAYFTPDSDCNMACTGNASYLCGAGNRISFYNWTGTPLTAWNSATGDAAGLYQFLIGGPVIPLVTTVGTNNKITFLEKFGTEPANNSTGAYELDLASLNNYTQAWRPMHVQTDVFCSASLTLPDKVGRQINIGGWANDATYGVRLYWPDGSPGVWGVNDWQENVNEVSLQVGRWYPSAMIMANGRRMNPISHMSAFLAYPLCRLYPRGWWGRRLKWCTRSIAGDSTKTCWCDRTTLLRLSRAYRSIQSLPVPCSSAIWRSFHCILQRSKDSG